MSERTRANWERSWASLVLGVSVIALTSCNHLFYVPSRQTFLDPGKLSKQYEKIWIEGSAGERLSAWALPAEDEAFGTVLHFHGNAENMTSHFLFVHWLTDAGFNVVVFDYRGYGESPGAPSRAGLVRDGELAINWVRNHPVYGKDGVFIMAQSLGGNVAVASLALAGQRDVLALVLDSTFTSYRDVARAKLGEMWLTWPLQWPLSFLVTDEASLVENVGDLRMPILVVHARNDPVVPFAMSEKIFAALGTKDRDFWQLSKGGHTAAFRDLESPYLTKLVSYFCQRSRKPVACQEYRIEWEEWLAELVADMKSRRAGRSNEP